MTPNEYQKEAEMFDSQKDLSEISAALEPDDGIDQVRLLNAALGLCGEAGEVTDIVKKHIFHESELDVTHIRREIGDVLWYVAQACNALGVDMEEVMEENIDKLSSRYPEGHFDAFHANNRQENDI